MKTVNTKEENTAVSGFEYTMSDWMLNPNFDKSKLTRDVNQVPAKRGPPMKPLGAVGPGWNERHDVLWELLRKGRRFTLFALQKYQNAERISIIQRLITICKEKDMLIHACGVEHKQGRAGVKPVVFRLVPSSMKES